MSTDRDVTGIVRSWLEEGATALPDRVLDSVLDQLPATSQRRAWWPAWRFREMNNVWKLAIAAAAVVAVAIVGINLLPGRGGVGVPVPSPTASPSPAPTATPTAVSSRAATMIEFPGFSNDVAAGTYFWSVQPSGDITFAVPAGWISRYGIAEKDRDGPGEMAIGLWFIENVYADPCRWKGSLLDPATGPTVDDLVTAIASQKRRTASPPTSITLGGMLAKRIQLTLASDLDITTCDQQWVRFWVSPGEDVANRPGVGDQEARSPRAGQINVVYIVDINGTRLVIDTWHMPGTSAADLAELDEIIGSLRLVP